MRILAPVAAPVNPAADEIKPDLGDFFRKSAMLAERFPVVDPQDYVMEIFGEAAMQAPMKVRDGDLDCYRDMPTRRQAFDEALRRGGIFLQYASFLRTGIPRVESLDELHAFVVDVDQVFPEDLAWILNEFYGRQAETTRMRIVPSYIVNTGRGVHFVFALEEPVICFRSNLPALHDIHHGLQFMLDCRDNFGAFGQVDKTWIAQPFRFPGVKTKLGNRAEAFRTGPTYTIKGLCEFFNTALKYHNRDEQAADKAARAAAAALRSAGASAPHGQDEAAPRPRPYPKPSQQFDYTKIVGWYQRTVMAAYSQTPLHSRCKAMFALAVMARAAAVPVETLERDLTSLARSWSARDGDAIKPSEIRNAVNAHGKRYKMTVERLTEYLGFNPSPNKRPRPRAKRGDTLEKQARALVEELQGTGEAFTTASLAERLGVPKDRVSKLVSVRRDGRRVIWKV